MTLDARIIALDAPEGKVIVGLIRDQGMMISTPTRKAQDTRKRADTVMAMEVQSVRVRGREKSWTIETTSTAEEQGRAMTTEGNLNAMSLLTKLEDHALGLKKGTGMMKGKMEEELRKSRGLIDKRDAGHRVKKSVQKGERERR